MGEKCENFLFWQSFLLHFEVISLDTARNESK